MNSIEKQILIGGRYSLRDPLGSGGMAEVFLVYEEVLERDVALKILREQYADGEGFALRPNLPDRQVKKVVVAAEAAATVERRQARRTCPRMGPRC